MKGQSPALALWLLGGGCGGFGVFGTLGRVDDAPLWLVAAALSLAGAGIVTALERCASALEERRRREPRVGAVGRELPILRERAGATGREEDR